ncbi:hypothetical protein Vadar_008187 [Vaccinium darrowii]|uniref:Uncharacterized protein n=1 Tax=Vaccinium darrowii TaxID=229202 RepID=A0ACB7X8Z5_9ERIC|nr:hypothetical protein Vadar_008187 [Vaccinium darrowii]
MSENINSGSANGDWNVQKQEEEEEGNGSSLISTADATDTEVSCKKTMKRSEKVVESGETSTEERADRLLLFEVCLIQSEAKMDRLLIPKELALVHFPPLANRRNTYSGRIKITIPEESSSMVTVSFNTTENAFVIVGSKWWREYVIRRNDLRPMDVIRFYRPVPAAHKYHFLVDFVRRAKQQIKNVPEFKPQNFLFQLNFTNTGSKTRTIAIPRQVEVRNYFPVVGIPVETLGIVRLQFTDARNNDWLVKVTVIVPNSTTRLYTMKFSEKLVVENNLEDGDLIRFYKPVQPSHARHFLIEFVKGHGEMLELSQVSGTAGNDGDGDHGTDVSGNREDEDEGATSGRDDNQCDGGGGSRGGSHPKEGKA